MTDKRKKEKSRKATKAILPTFRLEADGRGGFLSVTFIGILAVKEFSNTEITLATRRESMTAYGKKLEITVFENKTVLVSGEIEGIVFLGKSVGRNK